MEKNEGQTGVFLSNAALEPNRFVKIVTAAVGNAPPTVGYAIATDTVLVDKIIGVTTSRTTAAGQPVTVEFLHAQGTRVCCATDSILSAGFAFAAANGQVASTGTVKRGIAIGPSGGAGGYLEVFPIQS